MPQKMRHESQNPKIFFFSDRYESQNNDIEKQGDLYIRYIDKGRISIKVISFFFNNYI